MSAIRRLQRNVIKNQHSVTKDDDSGGARSNVSGKHRHYDDKSSVSYLKTMKADNLKKQNKATKRQKIG